MASIKFDNTEILDSTHIPRFIKHESATERFLNTLELARENGSVLVSDRRGRKIIRLQGILTATTEALLETAIDTFKELFARQEKNLDISWEGTGTRRYVASCIEHTFDRDHFHQLFVPWTAEFVVLSGIGEATTEDTIVNADTFTANYKTKAITLAGSAEPKIRFSIAIDSPNNTIKGVELQNTDTGERIIVPSASSLEGKTIEVDTRLKTVKIDSVESLYYGLFPKFSVGSNNIKISCGDIIDQQFAPTTRNSNYGVHSALKIAQGFRVPYTNTTYTSIWLEMAYVGNPSVACSVRIETDNAGAPSGTLVDVNAYGSISKPEMSGAGTPIWYQVFFNSSFALQSNTQYWIVLEPYAGGLNSSNAYQWYYEAGVYATYKFGNVGIYDGGWTQYPNDDMKFKLCFLGKYDTGWTQTYSVYQYKRFL